MGALIAHIVRIVNNNLTEDTLFGKECPFFELLKDVPKFAGAEKTVFSDFWLKNGLKYGIILYVPKIF